MIEAVQADEVHSANTMTEMIAFLEVSDHGGHS